MTVMPLMQMLRDVSIDAILYARDQVVLIEPPRSGDVEELEVVLQREHGEGARP